MRDAIRKVIAFDFGRSRPSERLRIESTTAGDASVRGVALLVTRDSLSLHWAPRWLQHTGLDLQIAGTADQAMEILSARSPCLVIADAALRLDDGSLLNGLREALGQDVPLIALCANDAEVSGATDVGVTDIVRKPYDWQVITTRAVRAVRAYEMLTELRDAREHLEALQAKATQAERARNKTAGLDRLTGLPNSDRFRSQLHRAVEIQGGTMSNVSVLVIGLDRYRQVNEAVGRQNADRLLEIFAERLKNCIRSREIIGAADCGMVMAMAARLSGARFALMVTNAATDEIVRVSHALQAELAEPFEVTGQSIYLGASIGASIITGSIVEPDALLHSAETAMLEARRSGSGFEISSIKSDASSLRLLKLDRMLREAIRDNDLELAFQPILATRNSKIVGAEALLRWQHADEGFISPADFVPVAEKTGLMREIGDFVILQACNQLRTWLDAGMQPIRMAINLSLCQLMRGDVVSVVEKALADNRLEPQWLEIELSERGVLNRRPEVVNEIHRLKAIGVRISIDDFGTGSAAIGYLKDLPIDVIKIDRSFVSGKDVNARVEAIASGMVALAQRLDATVIAEGVETSDQLDMLCEWGSQECQGFLFSPAIPGPDFLELFGQQH